MGLRHWGGGIAVLALIWALFAGCGQEETQRRTALESLAGEINDVFVRARTEIDSLKQETEALLGKPPQSAGLYPDTRYQLSRQYVLYTPEDDGGCEVWASGHIPVGKTEKARLKVYEHLCPLIKQVQTRNEFMDNVYLTTFDSMVMGYPFADMHAYMTPGLDLTRAWVTYWAAAPEANPEKNTLWVAPYIDAVGRGYMTSVITPVFYGDFLEATLGIDITVDLISDRFLTRARENLCIITDQTLLVAINPGAFEILNLKGLENYNYLKKEVENRAIPESRMMIHHPRYEIRTLAQWIQTPDPSAVISIAGRPFRLDKAPIPETQWFLVGLEAQ